MNIIVIDAKSGKTGALFIEELLKRNNALQITAIGTNAIATTSMLKAGAFQGATGENAIVVNARKADVIIGPLGIVLADAIMGEISEKIAVAIGKSDAYKILIPINLCNTLVVGTENLSLKKLIEKAVEQLLDFLNK